MVILSSADYKNEPIVKIEPDWAKSHPFLNPLIRFEPIRILYPFHQLLSEKSTHLSTKTMCAF